MTPDEKRASILQRITEIVDRLDAFAIEANHPEISKLAGDLDGIADELGDML